MSFKNKTFLIMKLEYNVSLFYNLFMQANKKVTLKKHLLFACRMANFWWTTVKGPASLTQYYWLLSDYNFNPKVTGKCNTLTHQTKYGFCIVFPRRQDIVISRILTVESGKTLFHKAFLCTWHIVKLVFLFSLILLWSLGVIQDYFCLPLLLLVMIVAFFESFKN